MSCNLLVPCYVQQELTIFTISDSYHVSFAAKKMKVATLVVLVLAVSMAMAKEQTSAQVVAVSQADVTLSKQDIATYGVPPKVYTYDFRQCFYCNYTCTIQHSFTQQVEAHNNCLNTCSQQDFCKKWVKPQYKPEVFPHAMLWRPVVVPADLACQLKLATMVETGADSKKPSFFRYKPTYLPYPWMCVTRVEPEFIVPEYKPDPAPVVVYITPNYQVQANAQQPLQALRLYLPPNVIAQHQLAPCNQTVVIYGN